MIILDTNVVSALLRPDHNKSVIEWLDRQDPGALWLTTITIFELERGVLVLAPGRRKSFLAEEVKRILVDHFANRILDFDVQAAIAAADLATRRDLGGRPAGTPDTLIAGIAVSRQAAIATRNTRHFDDLPIALIDPWTAPAPPP